MTMELQPRSLRLSTSDVKAQERHSATERQGAGRLLIVSNRLPVTLRVGDDGGAELHPSPGGLATGLWAPHQAGEGSWIGWPGSLADLDPADVARVHGRLEELRLIPIDLSAEEIKRYYESYANGVLWPLFHYLPANCRSR